MKLRKQTKSPTGIDNVVGINMPEGLNNQPGNDSPAITPADHGPHDFESPEEISFRNFLKDQLPRFKASPDLGRRILNSIEGEHDERD
jgi:hypothetical protein